MNGYMTLKFFFFFLVFIVFHLKFVIFSYSYCLMVIVIYKKKIEIIQLNHKTLKIRSKIKNSLKSQIDQTKSIQTRAVRFDSIFPLIWFSLIFKNYKNLIFKFI